MRVVAGDPADRLGVHVIYAKAIGVAALLAVLAWAGHAAYSWAYDNGYNAAGVAAQKTIADFAKAEADAQAKARKAEQAKAAEVAKIAEQTEARINEVEAAADRRIAGLESGAIRLRQQWAGCETDRLSGAAANSTELARQDRLRRESLRRVFGWVGKLQAQRDGLLELAEADRE